MKTHFRLGFGLLSVILAVQFIGCGAADISSAKLYREQRNYKLADARLESAIKGDPTNDEAWYLYIVNLYDLKNYEKISDLIDTAQLYSITHRKELDLYRQNAWIELYNGAVSTYNQNPDSKDGQTAALGYLAAAKKLEPDQPETYMLMGEIYNHSLDTLKAINTYKEALDQVSSMHDQGISIGLLLHMSPANAEKAIGGSPARKQTVWIGGNDSSLVYVYPSKQAFIYFERAPKAPHDWQLTGWRFTQQDNAGMKPLRVSTDMYEYVGNYYYQLGLRAMEGKNKTEATKEFDKAIPVLLTLQQLDPSDEFASTAIPDIYLREERTDKAKVQYQKLLDEHPSKAIYVSYGTLLMKSDDYDGAIAAFGKALDLDPGYEPALYDIGAAYKNSASADQKAGKKLKDIQPKLEKSTEYFEKLHAVDKTDYASLAQLYENYDILGKKDKTAYLLTEFEALKTTDAGNNPDFWNTLGQLYARANRPDESAAAYKKADQLKH